MVTIDKIILWAKTHKLNFQFNGDYSCTISQPWNIKDSNKSNISFISNGWTENNAGVVFCTETIAESKNSLIIFTKTPKYHFVKCILEFFKPEKCKIIKGKNVLIGKNCSIGQTGFQFIRDGNKLIRFPHFGNIILEDDVEIGNNVCIARGALSNTIIKRGAKIDNLVHIAHNVQIGENTSVVAHAMIAGSVIIGNNCWIAPSSSIKNQIKIGDNSLIGMGAVVINDVEPNSVMVGNPARLLRKQ